ncbi:MAG TPA: radical SAM protein, partial [Gemmatirosa sp.]|nr:radical SAM protein [Gemmatirosa sp.]
MDLDRRLALLSDAARFDAPCIGRAPARAGGRTRAALPTLQPAAVPPTLIQESVAGDGRTVRLLRLLLTSHCIHDCAYCPLRRSADPERARLSARDVVRVVMDHHRRGLIDGLFLSSAVDRDADHTMGELVAVARLLRREQHYLGYVHLKVVPEADPALIDEAARWADRVSVNVELPSQRRLDALAPGRRLATMTRAMDRLRDGITDAYDGWRWRQRTVGWPLRGSGGGRLPRYAPAGQVTQLVVGVDDTTDAELLRAASELYRRERLRRVYYGGFVPTVGQPDGLPDVAS